jgi:glycopeptide antibiotics resistance protein
LIAFLCFIPGSDLPRISWAELVSLDKWVHLSLFFFLFTFWWLCFPRHSYIIIALCILYGGALELMQGYLFSERSADVFDFIANSLGVMLGWVMCTKYGGRFYSKALT